MTPNQTINETTSATPESPDAQRAKPNRKPAPVAKPATPEEGKQTKQALLITLLERPEGASIAELGEATGWQTHSIRGAISFALKKKLGLNVTSQRDEARGRVYRIGKPAKTTKGPGTRTKKRP